MRSANILKRAACLVSAILLHCYSFLNRSKMLPESNRCDSRSAVSWQRSNDNTDESLSTWKAGGRHFLDETLLKETG